MDVQRAADLLLSRAGRLLNGQHRLSAVLKAGQPIEVLVMRGLPEEAFETYDKQAKKAPAVDEMFEDFGDKALISATAVLLWRRELKPAGEPNARPTASEIRDVITAHPELMRLRGFARKLVHYGRSSALVYAGYRVMRDDPELGHVFLDRLHAANLPAGHIILRLRDRLIISPVRWTSNAQVDEILVAWAGSGSGLAFRSETEREPTVASLVAVEQGERLMRRGIPLLVRSRSRARTERRGDLGQIAPRLVRCGGGAQPP